MNEGLTVQNSLASGLLLRGLRDRRESARLARREAILATLAQYPRLRDGMVAAGISWPFLVGMMHHRGFKAALRRIIQSHRRPGAIQRRRKERLAVRFELQRAGLPLRVAHEMSHQVVDPRPPVEAEVIQGIL